MGFACSHVGPRIWGRHMTDLSWKPGSADSSICINSALRALAAELTLAQEEALGVQDTIHEVVECLGDKPCDAIFRLQRMDYLAQILGDLSAFVDKIGGSVPDSVGIPVANATEGLHLRDLAHRLLGHTDKQVPDGLDDDILFDPL